MPDNFFQSTHHELTEEETRVEQARMRRTRSLLSDPSPSNHTLGNTNIRRAKSMGAAIRRASSPHPHYPIDEGALGTGDTTPRGIEAGSATELAGGRVGEKERGRDKEGSEEPPTPVNDEEEHVLVVDWDGPEDPENPKNWEYRNKWGATIVVSSFTFISPLASSMVAPAVSTLGAELGIQSTTVRALCISIFILGYALGPLFIGPLSEIFGRAVVLQGANLFFLAWNTGCGFAQSESQLLAFRFLAGIGGSAPLSIGGGVLGDIWKPEQRGQAISIYSLAPLLGPVLGPIMGAWIAQRTTWRWVFWSTSLFDVAIQVVGFLFLQETYAPVLLERKAQRIRRELGSSVRDTEKGPPRIVRTVYESEESRSWSTIFKKALTRPFMIFAREPIIQVLGIYMAFIYGVMYLFLTSLPSIFEGIYGQAPGIAGLHYLSLGVGLTGASQINARALDRLYKYLKEKNGGAEKPEYRLPPMIPASIILPVGLLIAGWTAQAHTHWIAPDIGLALIGAGIILTFQSIQTYVIDTFTLHAASALAAVSCLRSLAGFGFPLVGPTMFSHLGFGVGGTILAVVAIVLGCPTPWLLWKYGERIRKSSRYAKR